MPKRWQPHHQDRAGRLTPCLLRNLTVFNRSMRKTHRQPMFLKEQRALLLLLFIDAVVVTKNQCINEEYINTNTIIFSTHITFHDYNSL